MNYRPYDRKSTDSRRRTSQVSNFGKIIMDPMIEDIKEGIDEFHYMEDNGSDEMKLCHTPGRKEIR